MDDGIQWTLMLSGLKIAKLEVAGSHWMEGSDFHFTALGTSDEFACDYTMDLLIPQVPNKNLTYRHRHTLENVDKIVPLFGNSVKAEKVTLDDRKYLRTEFKVPLKTPRGEDLDDNIIYSEWIKKKLDAKEPPGISYHWQYELNKDKKMKWATLLEIAGTPSPACKECLVSPPAAGEMKMEEKEKQELEKMNAKQLQDKLEQMTLEVDAKKEELRKKLEEIDAISKERDSFKQNLDKEKLEADTTSKLVKKLSDDQILLRTELEGMKAENAYLISGKKKLIDGLVELEGDPELVPFYKTKDEAYLKKRLEKLTPKPDVSTVDPARKMLQARKQLEGDEPKMDDIMKNLAPNLREQFAKIVKKEGGN